MFRRFQCVEKILQAPDPILKKYGELPDPRRLKTGAPLGLGWKDLFHQNQLTWSE
jgi:hypothetical protein